MIIDPSKRLFEGSFQAFIEQKSKDLMLVPNKIIRNILGWSFEPNYDHPFTHGLLDYAQDKSVKPQETKMHRFYQHYTPKTLFETFFDHQNDPDLKGLTATDLDILKKTSSKTLITPWANEAILMGGFGQNMPEAEGSHFLGPVSDRHLTSEYQRLVSIYESVKTHGFNVDQQTDTIRGYFLRHEDEYRFVVVGGNHRVGVLNALNYTSTPIQMHPERMPLVSLETIEQWPQVANGTFTKAMAKILFLQFFSSPRRLNDWQF